MTCCICSQPAIGTASNGRTYCHRPACFCWRGERLKFQIEREAKKAALVRWAARHGLWGF